MRKYPPVTPDQMAAKGAASHTHTDLLAKAGGTMTGAIVLSADPAAALQPVTLQYLQANYYTKAEVDQAIADAIAAIP
ncbi:MAG: hypothetical protein ACAI44_21275 [Candidatus Sericytochromatia bacterium]